MIFIFFIKIIKQLIFLFFIFLALKIILQKNLISFLFYKIYLIINIIIPQSS